MGSLRTKLSGPVYVDTQIVIYSVETEAPYWPALAEFWQAAREGAVEPITSDLTLMETLVKPIRLKDETLIQAYDNFLHVPEMTLLPIEEDVLREAARLRAILPSLRTPDALHAATAMLRRCRHFLTNDYGFRDVADLPTVILRDLVQTPQ